MQGREPGLLAPRGCALCLSVFPVCALRAALPRSLLEAQGGGEGGGVAERALTSEIHKPGFRLGPPTSWLWGSGLSITL